MPRNVSSSKRSRALGKVPYQEGDWFAVPLRDGGYVIGLVARAAPGGKILLGYFFGPRRDRVPTLTELGPLQASRAALIAQFGDLGLIERSWPIIGHFDVWNRKAWPMPRFVRTDAVSGQTRLVEYADDDPSHEVAVTPLLGGTPIDQPKDGLLGAGAVELRLTKLLAHSSDQG